MKHITIFLVCAMAYCLGVQAQSSIPHSQTGFDLERTGIAKGKIDTVTYNSKTVGTTQSTPYLLCRTRRARFQGVEE